MTKLIEELSESDLKQRIENIKAEREKTANALKRYEEELERRKQEVPLGVPSTKRLDKYFWICCHDGGVQEWRDFNGSSEILFSYALNYFPTKESAKKHTEMLLEWRKALVANAKGEPIDIKVLLPLLPKGWVAMHKRGIWLWFKDKPELGSLSMWFSYDKKSERYFSGYAIDLFNLKPAEDWLNSLMECGL